jgi:hypothetical protein
MWVKPASTRRGARNVGVRKAKQLGRVAGGRESAVDNPRRPCGEPLEKSGNPVNCTRYIPPTRTGARACDRPPDPGFENGRTKSPNPFGHNDFHKVHVNGATAWLYGCNALNTTLFGFGERTGNPPLEGAVMEYVGLRGDLCGVDTMAVLPPRT